jgi:hypothetical protein
MVKAGVSADTIVLAIQQSATNFDTSAESIIQLKNLGIPEKILQAVLSNKSRPAPSTAIREINADTRTVNSELRGNVSAVTRDGGLKPARLATVSVVQADSAAAAKILGALNTSQEELNKLAQEHRIIEANNALADEAQVARILKFEVLNLEGPYLQYARTELNLKRREHEITRLTNSQDELAKALRALAYFIDGVREWQKAGEVRTVFNGSTDENGGFSIERLAPGDYVVIVIGRAGQNAAVWAEQLKIPSATDSLKLNSPKLSFFDPDGKATF